MWNRRVRELALVLLVVAAGCGRLGYDPLRPSPILDGGVDLREAEPIADAADGPGMQADRMAPADAATLPADTAPADSAPADTAPADTVLAPDRAPDQMDMAPPRPVCSAADLIADFEDGTLNTNRVGNRGGPAFHMVDPTLGRIANVAMPFCGLRVLQLQPIGMPPQAPLVQAHFLPDDQAGNSQLLDARPFAGIVVAMRASTPIAVRVKLPSQETVAGGNDHFQVSIDVGTAWSQGSYGWGAFRQAGWPGATQYPTFNRSRLYAIEISASLPAGATLWVDHIAFIR